MYVEMEVQNTHRAVGTTLSHEVSPGLYAEGRVWVLELTAVKSL